MHFSLGAVLDTPNISRSIVGSKLSLVILPSRTCLPIKRWGDGFKKYINPLLSLSPNSGLNLQPASHRIYSHHKTPSIIQEQFEMQLYKVLYISLLPLTLATPIPSPDLEERGDFDKFYNKIEARWDCESLIATVMEYAAECVRLSHIVDISGQAAYYKVRYFPSSPPSVWHLRFTSVSRN